MRHSLATLVLLSALPALAQGVERHAYLDIYRFTPSLSGHFVGESDGNPIDLDFQKDLALGRDKTRIGLGVEYQGPRFGLELSTDGQDYAGRNIVSKSVSVEGETFKVNTLVLSRLKTTTTTFNWTIRYLTWPKFWLGLDLGARVTTLQFHLDGLNAFSGATVTADFKAPVPTPQLGPSLGFTAFDGRLQGRGLVHLLSFKGASYTHVGADLRYFPLSWMGVRVFTDSERFRVPKGSLTSDLDSTLDRTGTGFGVVARF